MKPSKNFLPDYNISFVPESPTDKYKEELLCLINNLDKISSEFDNLRINECNYLVKTGISELSKMPKDKNINLVLAHYRKW